MKTGIVILAAGNSSRLGKPKQLLRFREETLLKRACTAAIEANLKPIVVVLGAFSDVIYQEHQYLPVQFCFNENWQKGMSTSISTGVKQLLQLDSSVDNMILAVCDQAFIAPKIFIDLIHQRIQSKKNIVCSGYANTSGTPTLFNKKYFEALQLLDGKNGAKNIIMQYPDDVETIPFELGYVDIDTNHDYNKLIQEND